MALQKGNSVNKPAVKQVRNPGIAVIAAAGLLYAGGALPAATIERLALDLLLCGGVLSGFGQRAYFGTKPRSKRG